MSDHFRYVLYGLLFGALSAALFVAGATWPWLAVLAPFVVFGPALLPLRRRGRGSAPAGSDQAAGRSGERPAGVTVEFTHVNRRFRHRHCAQIPSYGYYFDRVRGSTADIYITAEDRRGSWSAMKLVYQGPLAAYCPLLDGSLMLVVSGKFAHKIYHLPVGQTFGESELLYHGPADDWAVTDGNLVVGGKRALPSLSLALPVHRGVHRRDCGAGCGNRVVSQAGNWQLADFPSLRLRAEGPPSWRLTPTWVWRREGRNSLVLSNQPT